MSTLTWILHRCYHQLETVCIGSPAIRNILQSHEIRASQYRVHRVLCVAARDVDLECINRMWVSSRVCFVFVRVSSGWSIPATIASSLLLPCSRKVPHDDDDEAGDDEVFCGTCNVPRRAVCSLCKSCSSSRVHQSVRASVCVHVCMWLWLCVCPGTCVCVRVIVEAFAVAAFLDTTFWFFSAAADPVGALWAVWTVGVAGSALWHILILLCAAENANFSLHFVEFPFPRYALPALSLYFVSVCVCVCVANL